MNNGREYYLDNIRIVAIYSLFIFHTCEIYYINEGFYIEASDRLIPTLIYNFASPWLMCVLFFVAGMSTMLAFKKRSLKEYYLDRTKRVLLPFAIGMVCWIPWSTYFVLKNHGNFEGTLLDGYGFFWTHYSEGFLGYDGGWTPAHLWFLACLYVITLFFFPLIRWKRDNIDKSEIRFGWRHIVLTILAVFILAYGTTDESIGKFILFFGLGIVLYNNASFWEIISGRWRGLVCVAFVSDSIVAYLLILSKNFGIWTWQYAVMRLAWSVACVLSVFAFIGLFRAKINNSNRVMRQLARSSFAVYFFHMQVIIAVGYMVVKYWNVAYGFQMAAIMFGSVLITLLLTCVAKKIPIINNLLGLNRVYKKVLNEDNA